MTQEQDTHNSVIPAHAQWMPTEFVFPTATTAKPLKVYVFWDEGCREYCHNRVTYVIIATSKEEAVATALKDYRLHHFARAEAEYESFREELTNNCREHSVTNGIIYAG